MDAKRRAIAPPSEEQKSLRAVDSAQEKRKKGHDDHDDTKRRAIADATTGLPIVPRVESEELSYSDEECLRLEKLMDDYENEVITVVFYSKIDDFSSGKFVVFEDANADAKPLPLIELLEKFFVAHSESHMRAFDLIKKQILSNELKMKEYKYDGHGKMIRAEMELCKDGYVGSMIVRCDEKFGVESICQNVSVSCWLDDVNYLGGHDIGILDFKNKTIYPLLLSLQFSKPQKD